MENIFLACFAFGVLFTLASLVLGFAGHGAAHFGHGPGPLGGAAPHAGGSAGHLGHAAAHPSQAAVHVTGSTADGGTQTGHPAPNQINAHAAGGLASLPLLNASSVVSGLIWFGAAGYLLLRLGSLAWPAVLVGALLAAGIGWYLVARFLGLVLSGEREMDPDDYRLEGTVSQVTVGIPAGGTGEVVFSKAGARRSEAARGMGGAAIARGAEVVITSYADGFATVQPWAEFIAARENFRQLASENREA